MWCVYFAVLALLITLWLLVNLVRLLLQAPTILIVLLTFLVHTQRYYTHGGISQA